MSAARTVCWFSCGAASAIATKLTLAKNPEAIVVNCAILEEHPDNARFLRDCEKWFGKKILVIGGDKYGRSVDEVVRKTRYLVGPAGARCTTELKKNVRLRFQEPGDLQVFGYTREEQNRADRFIDSNPEVNLLTPLIDSDLGKSDCLAILAKNGIELPAMYKLGFRNNNCIGCLKGGAGYHNLVRKVFPERFLQVAALEREVGRTICKHKGKRVFLDELPPDAGDPVKDLPVSCSFACEFIELEANLDNSNEPE